MRFATWESGGRVAAGVVSDAGLHALPARTTVLDLVRAGLPAAIDAGAAALGDPAVPLESVRLLPPLAAPTVRDFVAFEEHVEGVRKASTASPASCLSGTRHRRSTSPTLTR